MSRRSRGDGLLWFLTYLLLMLVILGCDKVVYQEPHPETARIEQQEDSCTHAGFCGHYGPGFNGEWRYRFGFSASCPGNRMLEVETMEVSRTYESGKRSRVRERSRILRQVTECR